MSGDPLADVLYEATTAWEEANFEKEWEEGDPDLVDVLARAAREHIAPEIEAAYVPGEVDLYDHAAGLDQAARIARGQS